MNHQMRLTPVPFQKMKTGQKTVEVRLNDPKRQRLNVGDEITFINTDTNESLTAVVVALRSYPTFQELYENVLWENELGCYDYDMQKMLDETYLIYNKVQEETYGALAIKIWVK